MAEPTMQEVLRWEAEENDDGWEGNMRPIYGRLCALVERKRHVLAAGQWSPGARLKVEELLEELAAILYGPEGKP